jgi:hypothetical protein
LQGSHSNCLKLLRQRKAFDPADVLIEERPDIAVFELEVHRAFFESFDLEEAEVIPGVESISYNYQIF